MIAKDAVVTVAGTSEVESQSSAIAKSTGITSDTLSALKVGADIGQRISGKRKEWRMNAYDQIHKAYIDSLKNNFWDAWGIVANPITIYELTADAKSRMKLNYEVSGDVTTIFGLVVIPCTPCERDKVYVVDEQLGRTILGQTERSE